MEWCLVLCAVAVVFLFGVIAGGAAELRRASKYWKVVIDDLNARHEGEIAKLKEDFRLRWHNLSDAHKREMKSLKLDVLAVLNGEHEAKKS